MGQEDDHPLFAAAQFQQGSLRRAERAADGCLDAQNAADIGITCVSLPAGKAAVSTDKTFVPGDDAEIVVRPEAIVIGDEGMLPCTVELSCFMGSYQNYHVRVGDTLVKITDNCPINKKIYGVGDSAFISFDANCAHLL